MIIDGALFLVFVWSMLYFVAKEMYNDILPEKIVDNRRQMLLELLGIACFISIPLGLVYICFEFIRLTLKIIWDNVKLAVEIHREFRKLKSGEQK